MDESKKDRFLKIRTASKCGIRESTEEEREFLAECREMYPDECRELEVEVQHRAMESVNPLYQRPPVEDTTPTNET